MSYQVLARKWRPATFKQMVGQEHVLQALINGLDSDRLHHAYLFSGFKVYLIDEVHMLSKHSFNALLKTLEEPPPHVKFLLATTDPQKVPVTVLSRCLQFNLKRMSRAQIMSQLQYLVEQEHLEAEPAALIQLARAADGSMRDALSLLDQAIAHGGGAVPLSAVDSMLGAISRDYLVKLLAALSQLDAVEMLRETRAIIDNNPDYQRVCGEMIAMLQQIAVYQNAPGQLIDDDLGEETLQHYASHWSAEEIQLFYQILLQGRQDLLICPDEAAGFEMLMLRLLAFAPGDDSVDLKKKSEVIPPANQPEAVKIAAAISPAPVVEAVVKARITADADLPAEKPPHADVPALHVSDSELPEPGLDIQSSGAETVLPPETAENSSPPVSADSQGLDWTSLAYELGLEGLAQEVAANSLLVSWQDSQFTLNLASEIFDLRSSMIEDEISQALKQKLGVSLNLELISNPDLSGDTPLQARIKRRHRERLDAIEAIRQVRMVKKLQQAFSVELDEASVSRIED